MSGKRARKGSDTKSAPAAKRVKNEGGASGSKAVKAESKEHILYTDEEVDAYLMEFMGANPEGFSAMALKDHPKYAIGDLVQRVNYLANQNKIDIKKKGGALFFMPVQVLEQTRMKDMSAEERQVYNVIRNAGNKGVWTRDIKYDCGLQQAQLTKLLKGLESKRAVKAIKTVVQSKKKVYMLYELEPDKSLTGGAWYSENAFDEALVEMLISKTYEIMINHSKAVNLNANKMIKGILQRIEHEYLTVERVHSLIAVLKGLDGERALFNCEFDHGEVQSILDALVLEGKVERTEAPLKWVHRVDSTSCAAKAEKGTVLYRAARKDLLEPLFEQTPRGVTPAFPCGIVDEQTAVLLMHQALLPLQTK